MNNEKKKPVKKKPGRHGAGQTFDVMRPGRAPADATSRPAIVGHKPLVHDPMMADTSRRPLLGHRKEVVPALEPAPAEEGLAQPAAADSTGAAVLPGAVPVDAPVVPSVAPPAPASASQPPVAAPPSHTQGAAEYVAPVLTGRPTASNASPAEPTSSPADQPVSTPKIELDPIPLAPVLQPSMNGASAPSSPTGAVPPVHTPAPSTQSVNPADAPATTDSAPSPASQLHISISDPAKPTIVSTSTGNLADAMPSKHPTSKPATSVSQPPSVADQIAPTPAKPVKPLPKEAFDALASEEKKSPTPHPSTSVVNGMVVSHHGPGKHLWLWIFLVLVIAAAALAVWFYLG